MDFQNDIVDSKGMFGAQGIANQVQEKQAIENTAKAMAAARNGGVRLIHVAVAFRPGHPEIVRVMRYVRKSSCSTGPVQC